MQKLLLSLHLRVCVHQVKIETRVHFRTQLQRSEHKAITVELIHMDIRYQKEYLTFPKRNIKKSVVLVDILQLEANKKD